MQRKIVNKESYSAGKYEGHNDDDIYVLGLAKFNIYNNSALYTSYNNEEEIYKEVKETLKRLGFDVTDDYIIKNTGKIWGTYFG